MAMLNNAFDIAVYFMALHEDEIVSEIRKVLDALVGSIENSNQFMKSKIYLSKQLLPNFTFNAAKRFLKVTSHKSGDNSIEKNLFTHSENPLQLICLLYEFLNLLKKKFFSLNNQCSALMGTLKTLALQYIKEIEDENFLSQLLYSNDYEGRDTLEIVRQIEFLELIQEPKVEAVIQRIYSSDFDVSGHLLSGSTTYKILAQSSKSQLDIEQENRFYRKKNIEEMPQHILQLQIYKYSMKSRLLALGVIVLAYVIFALTFYNKTVSRYSDIINDYTEQLTMMSDLEEI